jgi:hypothetical protein
MFNFLLYINRRPKLRYFSRNICTRHYTNLKHFSWFLNRCSIKSNNYIIDVERLKDYTLKNCTYLLKKKLPSL